jgi:WD40 repeat protein
MSYPAPLLSHISSRSFYVTGGTLRRDAPSYVQRDADSRLFEKLMLGKFCYVLTARQMGKSSLMVQTAGHLQEEGITVVALDLTAIGQNLSPEQWYGGLLSQMGEQLELEDQLLEFWRENTQLGPLQRLMYAIRQVVLPRFSNPIVIFIDEIDTVRTLSFSTDEFFAGIRELYNYRAKNRDLERLTFCLLGVATPSDLIRDTRVTPFNIGERVELHDFTAAQSSTLAGGLGREEKAGAALLDRVLYWTGGHPYLTQRLCQAVAEDTGVTDARGVDRLCRGLFLGARARERDDNLLFVREWLLRNDGDSAGTLDLYNRVRRGKRIADDETIPRVSTLRLSGVTRTIDGRLRVRNEIYSRVFDRKWIQANMPDAELRRQRAAYRRGLFRASAIGLPIMVIIVTLSVFSLRERNLVRAHEQVNRRLLYASNMNLALQDWENQDIGPVSEILDAHVPKPGEEDMRGFEWYYLWRLCHQDVATMRHSETVNAVAYSPDGRLIASGSSDGRLKLWDTATFHEIRSLVGHSGWVLSVAFSPDGTRLASGSTDHTVRLWDTATGKTTQTLVGLTGAARSVGFSPDGRRLATGIDGGRVKVWDAASGKELSTFGSEDRDRNWAVFSPDGRKLATGGDDLSTQDGEVTLWNARTGERFLTLNEKRRYLRCIAFSSDGKRLATATTSTTAPNVTLKIWSTEDGKELLSLQTNTAYVYSLAFSPDGRKIVAGDSDHVVTVFDALTGQVLLLLKGHARLIKSVAFSPDGNFVVSGSDDNTLKVWDVNKTPQPNSLTSHSGTVFSVAFSPDGRTFASASADGTLILWDARTSRQTRLIKRVEGTIRISGQVPVSFSPDGLRVVSTDNDGNAKIWDVLTGNEVLVVRGHTKKVNSALFSPDGKLLATTSSDTTARLWDATNGQEVFTLRGHISNVRGASFSPDGKRLASGGLDHTLRVWDVFSGRELLTLRGHTDQIVGVTYSPDGSRIATGSQDGSVKVWDALTGNEVMTFRGHGDGIGQIAFSPDGKRLASASADHTLGLWDAHTGQEVLMLREHSDTVWTVAFSPDGKQLVSGSADHTIRLREAATEAEVRSRMR